MRLLIVEDDPDGREMLAELFRINHWSVTAVGTAHDAIDELRSAGFDVVISDENLEGESGSTMLREAFASGLLGKAGALMYTAQSGKLDVPPGVRILRKPLGLPKLLDEAKAAAPASASAADVEPAAPAPSDDDAEEPAQGSAAVQLDLYVTDSPSSMRALSNLKRLLERVPNSHITLNVHHLDARPLDRGATDDRIAMTPMLVKRGAGVAERFLGDLGSPSALAAILELEETPPASSADLPPSSRAS